MFLESIFYRYMEANITTHRDKLSYKVFINELRTDELKLFSYMLTSKGVHLFVIAKTVPWALIVYLLSAFSLSMVTSTPVRIAEKVVLLIFFANNLRFTTGDMIRNLLPDKRL